MVGAPHDFSRTTLRPFGPSVTVTVSARTRTPVSILLRASSLNLTILAGMVVVPSLVFDDAEDVVLAHDQILVAVQSDFRTRILAEENLVPRLHRQRQHLPFLVHLPFAHRDDFAFLRLLLGGIGDD